MVGWLNGWMAECIQPCNHVSHKAMKYIAAAKGSGERLVEKRGNAGNLCGKFWRERAVLGCVFMQINGVGQERHGEAILFVPVGVCQLKPVDFLVDVFDDLADGRLVVRLYFQRIWPSCYGNRELFIVILFHIREKGEIQNREAET